MAIDNKTLQGLTPPAFVFPTKQKQFGGKRVSPKKYLLSKQRQDPRKPAGRYHCNPKGAILHVERQRLRKAAQLAKKSGCVWWDGFYRGSLQGVSCTSALPQAGSEGPEERHVCELGHWHADAAGTTNLTWNIPKDAGSVSSHGDTNIAWHSMIHLFASFCMFDSGETNNIDQVGWGFGGFHETNPT